MKFTEAVVFDEFVAETGLTVDDVETFRFHCNYRAKSSTNKEQYNVLLNGPYHDAVGFVDWDGGLELEFFSNEFYHNPISTLSLSVGQTFFFGINWKEEWG